MINYEKEEIRLFEEIVELQQKRILNLKSELRNLWGIVWLLVFAIFVLVAL